MSTAGRDSSGSAELIASATSSSPGQTGAAPEAAAGEPTVDATVLYCCHCGAEVPGESVACPRCGQRPDAFGGPSAGALIGAGERRQLTVMFCDLADSTGHWTRLEPEEFLEVVRAYQALCRECVQRFDGHVAQYLGDGVLVYFGYPLAHEDDVARALHAGLAIVEALGGLNQLNAARGRPRINVRVGIHTGPVVTGRLGTSERGEVLALGSTPNLAARLQSVAESDTIVVSDATARLCQGWFDLEDLGERDIKGLPQSERIYRVRGLGPARSRLEAIRLARPSHFLPLVGRDHETSALARLWAEAVAGRPGLLLLRGEAGVGKSRLVDWLEAAAQQGGDGAAGTVVQWRCSPYHSNAALFPVIDGLSRRLDLGALSDPAARLRRLEDLLTDAGLAPSPGLPGAGAVPVAALPALPLLADLLGLALPTPLAMTPERRKVATLEVVTALLHGWAAQKPCLLVIEDVHWADPTTRDLLALIQRRSPEAGRFLCLVTARPPYDWPSTAPPIAVQELRGIDGPAVRALIAAVAGGKSLPAGVIERLVATTDGVPLFVEEVTAALLESGQLVAQGDSYDLAAGGAPDVLIPQSLRDSLTARLDRLGSARVTAHFASVIGRRFSLSLLEMICAPDSGSVRADLHKLHQAGLIYSLPEADGIYEFKHALVQLAAYETLLKQSRHEIHARVAQALYARRAEGQHDVRPELLAHHFTEAHNWSAAVHWWLQAGQLSLRSSANRETVAHVQAGLIALSHLPAGTPRDAAELALLSVQGPALIALAGFASEEVGRIYGRSRELGEKLAGRPEFFPSLWGSWVFHLVRGDLAVARSFAERMLALGQMTGDEAMLIEAHWTLGDALYWAGDLQLADRHLARAAALYAVDRHHVNAYHYGQDPGVATRCYWFITLWMQGQLRRASDVLDQAVQLAHELNHPFTTAWALVFEFMRSVFLRDHVSAGRIAQQAIALCTEQSHPFWLATAVVVQGWARTTGDDFEAGLVQMQQGLALYEATGSGVVQPLWYGLLADTLLERGRFEEAAAKVERGLAIAARTGERISEIDLHRIKGQLAAHGHRIDDAVAILRRAVSLSEELGARTPGLRAATALHRILVDHGLLRGIVTSPLPDLIESFDDGFETADLLCARAVV